VGDESGDLTLEAAKGMLQAAELRLQNPLPAGVPDSPETRAHYLRVAARAYAHWEKAVMLLRAESEGGE